MEVVYCDNCGFKIATGALSYGDNGKPYCAKCAPLYEHTSSALLNIAIPVAVPPEEQTTAVGMPAVQIPTSPQSVTKFYFCETCGKRITDKQILDGLGRDKKLNGVYCQNCAVGVMTLETLALTNEEAAKIVASPIFSTKASVAKYLPSTHEPRREIQPAKSSSSPISDKQFFKKSWIPSIGVLVLACIVTVICFVVSRGRHSDSLATASPSIPVHAAAMELQSHQEPTLVPARGPTQPPVRPIESAADDIHPEEHTSPKSLGIFDSTPPVDLTKLKRAEKVIDNIDNINTKTQDSARQPQSKAPKALEADPTVFENQLQHGLIGTYYHGREFVTEHLTQTRVEPKVALSDKDIARSDFFRADGCVRWTGFLKVQQCASYLLSLEKVGGGRLWVDENLLLDAWTNSGVRAKPVTLNEGFHAIKIEYLADHTVAHAEFLHVILTWKVDGGFDEETVPEKALFCPVAKKAIPTVNK